MPENYIDLLRQQAIDRAEDPIADRRTLQPLRLTGRQPNPALLEAYLRDAQWTWSDVRRDGARAVELRRVKAVRALHSLFLQWEADRAEVRARQLSYRVETDIVFPLLRERWTKRGAPSNFDRLLQEFFDWSGRAIFSSPDPPTAMHVFWKGVPRRGRKEETFAERNFDLALAVQKQVNAGSKIGKAIEAVTKTTDLSLEDVHKIYYRRRHEVRAHLWWVAFLVSEPEAVPGVKK